MNEVEELRARAADLDYGRELTAVLERAAEIAELTCDLETQFEVRGELASAANHGGDPQKGLVHITWCLAQIDAHPGRFETATTLWQLKWLPTLLVNYPDTTLDVLDELLSQVEARYRTEGSGEDAASKLRWVIAAKTGRTAEARELLPAWRLMPRSEYADCRVCDIADEVLLRLLAGDLDLAVGVAEPLLAAGRRCAEQPAIVFGDMVGTPEMLERPEAEQIARTGFDLVGDNPGMLLAAAGHLRYLVGRGEREKARQLATRVRAWGASTHVPWWRMAALASLSAAGEAGIEVGHDGAAAGARDLAARFDARNGNDFVSRLVEGWLGIRPAGVAPARTPTGGAAPAGHSSEEPAARPAPERDDAPSDVAVGLDEAALFTPVRRLAHARAVLARAEADGDDLEAARAERAIAACLRHLGDVEEARRLLDGLPARLERPGAELDRVLALVMDAELRADPDDASPVRERPWFVTAMAAAESAPAEVRSRAVAEVELTALRLRADDSPLAPEDFEVALGLLRDVPERLWSAQLTKATAAAAAGDLDGAVRTAEEAVATARGLAPYPAAVALRTLAGLLERADAPRALPVYAEAQRAAREAEDGTLAGDVAWAHADLLAAMNDPEGELALRYESLDHAVRSGRPEMAVWCRLEIGRCLRRLGRDQEAYDLWSDLLAARDPAAEPQAYAAIALDLALCDADHGYAEDAQQFAERALAALPEDAPERAPVLRLQATLATDPAEAASLAEQCVAAYLGAGWTSGAIRALYEQVERHVAAGRGDDAVTTLDRAEELAGVADVSLDRVALLADLGRAHDAAEAQERMPCTTAEECWRAARAALVVGRRDRAEGLFARAVETRRSEGAAPEELKRMADFSRELLESGSGGYQA